MAVDSALELLTDALRNKRSAMVELFLPLHVMSFRLALGLTGDRRLAETVARGVVRHSLRAIERINRRTLTSADVAAPGRIVRHRTIQLCRVRSAQPPAMDADPLVPSDTSPAYRAFISALRALPPQQFEVVLLTEGEQLPERAVATSMDCSLTAAQQHLKAAMDQLQLLAGHELGQHLLTLRQAYRSHEPDQQLTQSVVERAVTRRLLPRRLKQISVTLLAVLLLAAALWAWTKLG